MLPPETAYIGLEHIPAGGGDVVGSTVGTHELTSTKFAFDDRHVLFGKLRPNLGKVAWPQCAGVCSTDILPILPGPRLYAGYLAWFLRRPQTVSWAAGRAAGANLPRLSPSELGRLLLPLPPVQEQRRIAMIIDRSDHVRAKRVDTVGLLRELEASAYVRLFGDPLVDYRAWPSVPLQDVCALINDCPHSTPAWTEDGEVCLRTSNLGKGTWNWDDTRYVSPEDFRIRSARGLVMPGDIILSREGTVGVAALVEPNMRVCMGQRLVQVRPDVTQVTPRFLLRTLLTLLAPERIATVMVGSTARHLNVRDLRVLRIPVPPLRLQQTYESLVRDIEANVSLQREQLKELGALLSSVQDRAFKGEL